MIDFLDQLERDLVEAIDRRERAPAPRRPFPRVRLDVAAAAVALALAIALVVVIGSQHESEKAVKHPTTPTVTNPRPIPKGTPLRVVGALARVGPTAWTGPSRGPGGGGTLTLTGRVDLARRACCETPRADGARHTHALRFRWTTPGGELGGCLVNMVLRRPHGRYVWDAPGRVTIATGRLARYRGRSIALAGVTAAVRTNRTRIILSAEGRPPAGC